MNDPGPPGPEGAFGEMEGGHASTTAPAEPLTEYTHPLDYDAQQDATLAHINDALLLIEHDVKTFEARLDQQRATRFDSPSATEMYISTQNHLIVALSTQLHLLLAKNNHLGR